MIRDSISSPLASGTSSSCSCDINDFHQKRLSNHEHKTQDPIAIVGMGCRLPGGSNSPSKLWDLLTRNKSAQSSIPGSRFNISGFYHPEMQRPGSLNTAGGYFLDNDIRLFDNSFFGINNLEALYMDPEQKNLLEVVYECFESAGVTLQQVSGADVGCYVGNFTYDYLNVQNKDPEYLHRYSATGMSNSILANRVNHVFNLQGPSLVIDTACSSSLYCLHVACAALDAGDCTAAIVAGVNLIQSPEQQLATMRAGVLSPSSTCHTFDESADGYGRGESVGVLYLKRLSDAIRDEDPIRSVIRGTAVNSNGKTPGITLPSIDLQERVIKKAYSRAGLPLSMTDYVECHGTGTAVGDPIEVEALSKAFAPTSECPLLLGSIKPNVGHSEAASAISSIIKVTLALEKGEIPPTYGVHKINPRIHADSWNVKIVTEQTPWPDKTRTHIRRASVNSFGFGGANAHAVLESAESHVPFRYARLSRGLTLSKTFFLLPFSANTQEALEQRVHDLNGSAYFDLNIVDLAYTLTLKRSSLLIKGFVIASQKSLAKDLQVEHLRVVPKGQDPSARPLTYVFTGQGAQWPRMGRELFLDFFSYRQAIQRLDAVLHFLPDPPSWTIQEAIFEPEGTSQIHRAEISQPVCVAVQIALVQLLADWGIKPNFVVGHSSGEIGAAYAAGLLSEDQAIKVAFYRGLACSRASERGAMLAVGTSKQRAEAAIATLNLNDKLCVACVNSPQNVTISGDLNAVKEIQSHFQGGNVFNRELKTGGNAYHSLYMTSVSQEYEKMMAKVLPVAFQPQVMGERPQWVSTVTGTFINGLVDRGYWLTNLKSPVLFYDAVEKVLLKSKVRFVEVGPHPALELPVNQIASGIKKGASNMEYFHTICRGKSSVETLLQLAGSLHIRQHEILLDIVNQVDMLNSGQKCISSQGNTLVDLPNYSWNHDAPLWNESQLSKDFRHRIWPRHDLLGSRVPGTNGTSALFRNFLRLEDVPWLRDHQIGGTVVVPAAAYLAMIMEGICQLINVEHLNFPACEFQQVRIHRALAFSDREEERGVEVFTTFTSLPPSVRKKPGNIWQFSISSFLIGTTTVHATGTIRIDETPCTMRKNLNFDNSSMEQASVRSWYDKFSQVGLNFAGRFKSLTEMYTPKEKTLRQAIAGIELGRKTESSTESSYVLHPAVIDGILHAGLIATAAGSLGDCQLRVPVFMESLRINLPFGSEGDGLVTVHATAEPTGLDAMTASTEVYNGTNQPIIQAKNFRLIAPFQEESTGPLRHPMLRLTWRPDIFMMENGQKCGQHSHAMPGGERDSAPNTLQSFLAALDLLVHKNPRLRILEFGNGNTDSTEDTLGMLDFLKSFKRCMSYAQGHVVDQNGIRVRHATQAQSGQIEFDKKGITLRRAIDAVLCISRTSSEMLLSHIQSVKDQVLDTHGLILGFFDQSQRYILEAAGFSLLALSETEFTYLTLARRIEHSIISPHIHESSNVILITENPGHPLNLALEVTLAEFYGTGIHRVSFAECVGLTLDPESIIISTIELEKPLLSLIGSASFEVMKMIAGAASTLLWITGGDMLSGSRPDFAIAAGMARAIPLEQPAMKFLTLDIDKPAIGIDQTSSNILAAIRQASSDSNPDVEFIQKDGQLHICRFAPASNLNSRFRRKEGTENVLAQLNTVHPCQIAFERPKELESWYLKTLPETFFPGGNKLEPDFVEIEIKAVFFDSESSGALKGELDSKDGNLNLQSSGTVTRVGANVASLTSGCRVAVLAPGRFSSILRVPEWACIKLNKNENYVDGPLQLQNYATALYTLHHISQITRHDSVLVTSGASNLGIAAFKVCQRAGARVFSTVTSEQQKDFLATELSIDRSRLFNSENASVEMEILSATQGRGVDVILQTSSHTGAQIPWRACAPFGHIVEVGGLDMNENMAIWHEIAKKSISFKAVNMRNLYGQQNSKISTLWASFMDEAMALCRLNGQKSFFQPKVFDVGHLSECFELLCSDTDRGDVIVSLEDPQSLVKTVPSRYETRLHPEKSYLMIGCLGGLGRNLSEWMFSRGARSFVFLSRSGLQRQAARQFVEDLRTRGAKVVVVQGDVAILSDVERAVKETGEPLGGVVQAAMGLDESLFTTMSHEQWHTAIDPKVTGTWNVHNAIKGKDTDLDFFLMTSSISGSVGVATESNYCASNYFLDTFARFRRSAGLPAISVGLGMISQIGYLHEHPEIQNGLIHKGVSALDADDFLQIIDTALASSMNDARETEHDPLTRSHVLTGLEPLGLNELRKQGFEGIPATFADPRALLLDQALGGSSSASGATATNAFSAGLPAEVRDALLLLHQQEEEEDGNTTVFDTVLAVIVRQFSNFLLTPVEKLDVHKPLAGFGMDSMLAAAVRAWFYHKFDVNLTFMTLLSQTTSVSDLAGVVVERIMAM